MNDPTAINGVLADMRRKYMHARSLNLNPDWLKGEPLTVQILERWIPDVEALAARLAKVQARLRGVAADATHYKARLTEAEARIARLLEITESCEWCYLDARATVSASAVQPERCCLDYPRCDCNSPPEPDSLPCGHPASLLLRSAETGEPLYCELCDDKSGRRDAVQCETELRAEVDRLKAALKTVGDDYPGSSCQQWCYEAAGIRAPTLQPCGHPWKAQHDFKCILCSAPGDATYAQLAEEQRFLHGAAADAVEVERLQRLMQKIMARCADLLDEDQFNELDAMTRATDPTDAAT